MMMMSDTMRYLKGNIFPNRTKWKRFAPPQTSSTPGTWTSSTSGALKPHQDQPDFPIPH